MYADSPIIAYAITETANRIEMLGDVFENAPEGIVVSKDDQALTEAIQKAVQHLIDTGGYNDILTGWATQPGAVTKAEINPSAA